jgi:hypothetical protein
MTRWFVAASSALYVGAWKMPRRDSMAPNCFS